MPGGESFQDCVKNLEPFIVEVERQREPCLIVSHLSTLQMIYGYFMGMNFLDSLKVDIPHHCIIKLEPGMYGWKASKISLGILGGLLLLPFRNP